MRAVVIRWSLGVWLATSTNPVGDIFCCGTRHLHAHAREAIYVCCVLDLHGGRSALHVRAATALAKPFRGAGQVVKESIHGAEHERRALALDPRASRGD